MKITFFHFSPKLGIRIGKTEVIKSIKILNASLILLLVLFGCDSTILDPLITPDEPPVTVGSTIIIQPKEVLNGVSRSLVLSSSTEKAYPCVNYPLLSEKLFDDESFKITYTGVNETEFCQTAIGPAREEIFLQNVQIGDYYIELNNGSLKNKGILTITENTVELVLEQENGIQILTPKLNRVPQNTYWGYFDYQGIELEGSIQEFITDLEGLGAEFNKQIPGDYYYYHIDEEGEMVGSQKEPPYFNKTLIFQYTENEELLNELINSFQQQHEGIIFSRFESYKGERF